MQKHFWLASVNELTRETEGRAPAKPVWGHMKLPPVCVLLQMLPALPLSNGGEGVNIGSEHQEVRVRRVANRWSNCQCASLSREVGGVAAWLRPIQKVRRG